MKRYFQDWSNYFSFVLALITSFLMYIFAPGNSVPYAVFLMIFFLFILSVWLNIKQFFDRQEHVPSPIELIRCTNNTILCKPNGLLVYDSVVSFYELQENFEKYISSGRVTNINSKGVAQITLINFPPHIDSDVYDYISLHRSSIIVKPTITFETIQTIQNNI